MLNKDVTIVILTYKSTHIIDNVLKNLINTNYKIIIVDNGSNDNIENFLKKKYHSLAIELILLKYNVGFSKGNNIALKKIKTKFAFLLNPDSIITDQSIANLVKEANKEEKIALANPIFVSDKKSFLKEVKDNQKYKGSKCYNIVDRDFMCGGALLIKIKIFKKIGFFDENLFLYCEDDEISSRSINNGYKNILVKNSYCFHANQSSVEITSKWHKYKMVYFRYWHQGWGKTYLKKRKKNIIRIWLKVFHRLFLSFYYLIFKFDLTKSIARFALFMGSISNLIGIDCFNKDSKNLIIDRHVIL